MRRFLCCLGLLVILGINLLQVTPCTAAADINVDLICPDPECNRNKIIQEITEIGYLRVQTSLCRSCKLTVNTTRWNRINLYIYNIYFWSLFCIVHDGVGTLFTKDLFLCYITFRTNELEIYMDWHTSFSISAEGTHLDSLDSATKTTIVTDCDGLVHFDAEKNLDVDIELICSDLECTESDIMEIGELLAVDVSVCGPCRLTVNTTRQNRISLDIDNIYSHSFALPYIVHERKGTILTNDLTPCNITFLTNELEIYVDWYARFRISAESTNPDSLHSTTNDTIVTDCLGLVHLNAEKEPDVNVDFMCSGTDPWCTKNSIITEIGELLTVDTSRCKPCTLTVNTTRLNRIRLDIENIYSRSQSYMLHDGVGIVFTEDLTSCFIIFPTHELVIYMDQSSRFRISLEATNPDSLDSATNTTDCVGLVRFDAEKNLDVNVNLICSDPECTKSNHITEIGDLLELDIDRWCMPCRLTVNTTRQNKIRLDINNIYSLSKFYKSYIVHDGVGTLFTEDLIQCSITFPTHELAIYMDQSTKFRISTGATIQGSLASATDTTIHTDCKGLVHFDAEKEPDVNVDLICSDPECTRNRIITEIGDLLAVDTSSCSPCTLAVNTTKQNRIRLDISNIYSWSRFYIVHDGVVTLFTEDFIQCSITFPTHELAIYMDQSTKF